MPRGHQSAGRSLNAVWMVNRRQLWGIIALTLMWGVNWPMMKLSLQQMPPLHFRATTMLIGACGLFAYVALRGERMKPNAAEWRGIAQLGLPNVLGWHTMAIFGVKELASGRAAILGFTMPIMTVLLGAAFFWKRMTARVRLATVSAGLAASVIVQEVPYWQDWVAMVFTSDAIASLLWPAAKSGAATSTAPSPAHSPATGDKIDA